ncbi:hypothetical protein BC829DRAFT_491829 [Chytridium lagenaria]|nr:hypothetical protein BC829DRAFT_491829 [Chytridium lagenaria]
MFSDRNSNICKPDPDGVYFFDRNSACFSAILDGYRSNGTLNDLQYFSSSIHSTSPSNLLSPSDRKTLERTLMVMDRAKSWGDNNIVVHVDLDGIGVIVASVLEEDVQKREDGNRQVDLFEKALRERTGLGKTRCHSSLNRYGR